jgi:hypothetical protein
VHLDFDAAGLDAPKMATVIIRAPYPSTQQSGYGEKVAKLLARLSGVDYVEIDTNPFSRPPHDPFGNAVFTKIKTSTVPSHEELYTGWAEEVPEYLYRIDKERNPQSHSIKLPTTPFLGALLASITLPQLTSLVIDGLSPFNMNEIATAVTRLPNLPAVYLYVRSNPTNPIGSWKTLTSAVKARAQLEYVLYDSQYINEAAMSNVHWLVDACCWLEKQKRSRESRKAGGVARWPLLPGHVVNR